MENASIFKSNRSQAVRLPKAAAFPESVKRCDVVIIGRTRVLAPAGELWDSWFDAPKHERAEAEFLADREQPVTQERESF